MPAIPIGVGEAHRIAGKLPHIRRRNMMVEPDTTNYVDGLVRLQRPGFAPYLTVGTGPINAVWEQSGTFGGDHLVISKAKLWRVSGVPSATLIGDVKNSRAQFAGGKDRVVIACGGLAYSTDGITVAPIPMPDSVRVSSVAYLSGFFFFAVENSQRVYYIQPGEVDPTGLEFFEAERSPDFISTLAVINDELWIIGTDSVEIWYLTGDIDAPAQRVNARGYRDGCINRDTLVDVDGVLAWVTKDFQVVVAKGEPQTISNPAIVEHLRKADPTTFRAWWFQIDTHKFYVLTTGKDTFAFDLSYPEWARFSSYNTETWLAHLGARGIAGDATSNKLWQLAPDRSNDDGAAMVRELIGGLEIFAKPQRCDSVSIRVAVGRGLVAGVQSAMEMCWSDDEGQTWGDWRRLELGLPGDYRGGAVVVRRLGLMRRPGRLFWLRMTDDDVWRVSHMQVNEAYA